MSETLTERIKYISGIQPDHLISAFASDLDEIIQRAEAAEARAAQLETDNDEMQSYINEIRVTMHTEKDELTIEAVRRVISERDELAQKLEQAQTALIAVRDWFARNTKQGHTPGPTEKIIIDAIGS